MGKFVVLNYLLIDYKMVFIRDKNISIKIFREIVGEIGVLIIYEIIKDLEIVEIEVEILI